MMESSKYPSKSHNFLFEIQKSCHISSVLTFTRTESHELGTNFLFYHLLKMLKLIFYAKLKVEVCCIVLNSFRHRCLFQDQLGFSFLTLIPDHSSSLFTISTCHSRTHGTRKTKTKHGRRKRESELCCCCSDCT